MPTLLNTGRRKTFATNIFFAPLLYTRKLYRNNMLQWDDNDIICLYLENIHTTMMLFRERKKNVKKCANAQQTGRKMLLVVGLKANSQHFFAPLFLSSLWTNGHKFLKRFWMRGTGFIVGKKSSWRAFFDFFMNKKEKIL